MIQRFEVEGYACLKDVKIDLTPLHAFVGPNDSGKSMLLNAIHDGVAIATASPMRRVPAVWTAPTTTVRRCLMHGDGDILCEIRRTSEGFLPYFRVGGSPWYAPGDAPTKAAFSEAATVFGRAVAPVERRQFQPAVLREAWMPSSERQPGGFQSDDGKGLVSVYDWLLRLADGRFGQVVADLRHYFPSIDKMRVVLPQGGGQVELRFTLRDGVEVAAGQISEGVLYFLAYRALSLAQPVKTLLLEEPEAGLHPARIREVVGILRKITEDHGTQILLTTHSPLVLNELKADEVSVVTRTPDEGTRVTRIKDTPHFHDREKVYALGELWLAYCNGTDEAPLLRGDDVEAAR